MANNKAQAALAQGLSLHIGLNGVSGEPYGGWSGPLAACGIDASDRAAISKTRGMKSTLLLTKKAARAFGEAVTPVGLMAQLPKAPGG